MRTHYSPRFFAVQKTNRRSLLHVLILATVLAVSWIGSAPAQLRAQVVRGQIVDSTSGTPVGRGFAVLLDAQGNEVARSLSSTNGRFTLTAPSAGQYWLRSERIGFRASLSDPLELSSGETLEITLLVEALPVQLATLVVPGKDRCNANPEQSASTVLIWEEIRKALAATAWADEQEVFHYRQYTYRRDLNKHRDRKLDETGVRKSGYTDPPFRSVPAEQLAEEGYVVERNDGIWYYLPDAHTLLDDGFLDTHCFHVVRDEDDQPGQVGLAFEPMSDRRLPDVEGTLWLDEASSELRELELHHTGLQYNVRDPRIGGAVRFMMLPSGAWIVREWQVRTPWITVTENPRYPRGHRAEVEGFTDTGGEIYEVSTREGTTVYEAPVATINGSVFDSTSGVHLERAFVTLVGTDFRTHTNSAGRFELRVPLDGEYSLTLSHPHLDSVAAPSQIQAVELVRNAEVEVTFAVPHVRTAVGRLCGRAARDPESRTIFGVVRRAGSGTPAREASVNAIWQKVDVSGQAFAVANNSETVRTDDAGFFAICGIPAGRPVRLSARKNGETSGEANVLFPQQLEGTLSFAWDRRPGAPYDRAFSVHQPAWKVDLTLGTQSQQAVQLSSPLLYGVVTDSASGTPIAGATVVVNDSYRTATDASGRYELADVVWLESGNSIELRRAGYEPREMNLVIDEAEREILLSVALLPLPPQMEWF